jgi:hypothetical protein
MNTLCIIPCGSAKIWDKDSDAGPTAAQYVYTGGFSMNCKQYAMMFYPNSWCILSAKYGFLLPDDVVAGPARHVGYGAGPYRPVRGRVGGFSLLFRAEI